MTGFQGNAAHVIDVGLDAAERNGKPALLAKTDRYRIVRFDFRTGAKLAEHTAPGELMVLVLEGRIAFTAEGQASILQAGQIRCLPDRVPHSVEALDDAVVLLTIVSTNSPAPPSPA